MRLVLEANVVLSALIWDGPPERLLDLAVNGEVALFSSAVLLDELAGVLERGKSITALASRGFTPAFLTRRYGAVTTLVRPMPVDRTVAADPDDDHATGAELGARAETIASGDRHLLEPDPYRGIRILAPAAVLELVNSREGGTDAWSNRRRIADVGRDRDDQGWRIAHTAVCRGGGCAAGHWRSWTTRSGRLALG